MRWTSGRRCEIKPRVRWRTWFAWFPVVVNGRNAYPANYVWLERVERRKQQNIYGEYYGDYR